MSVSRRGFLRSGATAALVAGFALNFADFAFAQDSKRSTPSQDFEIPAEAQRNPVFYYTRATFDPYVGGIFRGRGVAGKVVELTLLAVRDCTPVSERALKAGVTRPPLSRPPRKTECFSLVFRASDELTDLTTIHTLDHAGLGKFNLFMTRREDERKRVFYEAVINHAR